MKRTFYPILTILGLLLVIGSIVTAAIIDRPLAHGQSVSFPDPAGDRLVGTYYAGTQPTGVILLEGFGSDQVTMRSLASEFARQGWHVLTFDFSGHGRSPGTLAFDNARTDRLAYQALSALDEFERLSGLRADQIFVVGHSLGARVALQSATMNPEKVAGLVLLGTQVNLSTNVQSEFFTGTTDADLPWVQALGPDNPPVPIILASGEWDDILTPDNARSLFVKLGGQDASYPRSLILVPNTFHNYEVFSGYILFLSLDEMANMQIPEMVYAKVDTSGYPLLFMPLRIRGWIIAFIGLLLVVIGGGQWAKMARPVEEPLLDVEITSLKRFLWGKLLLWLGALPVAGILGSLFFVIPLGKPVFNLIYVGFIGGYGILLAFLYWRGKMPGVKGKVWSAGDRSSNTQRQAVGFQKAWKPLLAALGIAVVVLILSAAYARTGWFTVPPANLRMVWLVIFTPFTALGFWIGQHESGMLRQAGGRGGAQTALTLIGLFPFFLYTLLMAALGSLSGMLGGLQGLLILALVLAFGALVQAVGRRPWLTAFCMAILLYWLILPQGVLFG